ncbi:hypothetical protein RHECNPAF_3500061 [Rhizobium etli CNPAF512]|nr:hypothetical protein RHECNPAF_3500061 [Rhizobium etli CNPAF512]
MRLPTLRTMSELSVIMNLCMVAPFPPHSSQRWASYNLRE